MGAIQVSEWLSGYGRSAFAVKHRDELVSHYGKYQTATR
ncbi:hypothetical protein PRUB_b0384 [Pseudoalteromonas rubra]|uniref:Uncharacterized protein n=1 Tax=Pseudoalteromonas rubra TaxID=43658 RepID=A0A8T0BZG1_9GAMM|nr:hypothetical protein PRUB_b0384 [Pseudoalteromonas rubra]